MPRGEEEMCSRICGVSGTRVADSWATPVFSLPESPPLPGGLLAQGAKTPLEEDFLCSFLLRTVQETTEKAELDFEGLDTQTVYAVSYTHLRAHET